MNKYEVHEVVGEGAYGVVLKCQHKETGEVLALKKFKETEDDELVRKTIVREVKALRMLKHDNIVQLHEAFRRKGQLCLVFEFVEKTLLELLEVHPTGIALCKAIDYCHQQEVVHRDIKPENVLISTSHVLKLCDFGFARLLGTHQVPLTDYVATRWYRSPELLLGSSEYGKAVDMWAIGCLMGELIDGQPLFPGKNEADQLHLIQSVLGPLTVAQQRMIAANPNLTGFKVSAVNPSDTLEKRYGDKIDMQALAFMSNLLKIDPGERMTAAEALLHPYFDEVRDHSIVPAALVRNDPRSRRATTFLISHNSIPRGKNHLDIVSGHTPKSTKVANPRYKRAEKSCSPAPLYPLQDRRSISIRDSSHLRTRGRLEEVFRLKLSRRKRTSVCEENYMFNISEEQTKKLPKKKTNPRINAEGRLQQYSRAGCYQPKHERKPQDLKSLNHQSARQLPYINTHFAEHRRRESRVNLRLATEESPGGGVALYDDIYQRTIRGFDSVLRR